MYPRAVAPDAEHPWIDDSEKPLYVVTYPRDRTDEDVRQGHRAIRSVYEKTSVPVAWVVDASAVRSAPATQRRIVAEHERSVRRYAERWCAGLAVVIPNALVRGFFTAVTWLAPLSFPHRLFETRPAAMAWARRQLDAADRRDRQSRDRTG